MLKMEYFYYIITINNTGSINKAADALYLSQPYLSTEIKTLESLLGIELFYRNNKGVNFTEAGKSFLAIAESVLELEKKAMFLNQKFSKQYNRHLELASMPSFTITDLISDFNSSFLEYANLNYTEMPNLQVLQNIINKKSDIGIYYLTSKNYHLTVNKLKKEGVLFKPLVNEPICAVVNQNNPLYHKDDIDISDLDNFDFLVESIKISGIKNLIVNNPFPELFNQSNNIPRFNNNRSMLYYLTKHNKNYCIGQRALNINSPHFKSNELKYLPIRNLRSSFITGYIRLEDTPVYDLMRAFIDYIENYFTAYSDDPNNAKFIFERVL